MSGNKQTSESTSSFFRAITPSDGADLAAETRAIWVGTTGAVVARDEFGVDTTFAAKGGSWIPIRTKRVLATGTTATGLVALF